MLFHEASCIIGVTVITSDKNVFFFAKWTNLSHAIKKMTSQAEGIILHFESLFNLTNHICSDGFYDFSEMVKFLRVILDSLRLGPYSLEPEET